MSPSGKHVAIVADDETEIQLVEIASGQVKLTIPCRYLRSPVTFSPSGKMIVFVAGTQVRMIDTSDGKELFSHRGSPEAASTIEFSGDAKRLLIGGWHRNPIGIWDFEEQELTTVDFGDDMNGSPSLSPDGRLVAAQDRGQVHLWSADGDRKSIPAKLPPNRRRFLLRRRGGVFESDVTGLIDDGARLSGHSQPAVDMALSADEMTLASCSPDKTIRIWNVKDGTESARINLDHEPTPPLALAPDASLVAVTVDGKLKVWRTDNLKNVSTVEVEADSLQTIQFSADAAQIAIGDAAGGVRVFKSVGGHEVKAWQAHDKAVSGLAFSADGKLLCSAGADGAVHFWNADTLQKRSSVTEKLGPVTEINLGVDSNQLAMVEADGRISVWDIAAQTIAHRYSETSGTPTGVKIDTDNHKVRWLYGTTRYNRHYREWELKTGNTRGKSIGLSWSHTLQYAFSPDSRTLATATSGAVRLWELPSGKWLKDLESPVDCSKCIAISPDGDLVAAGGMGLVIFHLREDRPPLVVGTDRVGTPEHIGFSPDGRLLVVERSPQSVQIIEASTGRLIRELATVPGTVRDKFTFSHDGRILMFYEGYWLGYSAGQPCRLTFWEVETGRKLGELAGQPLGAQSHSLSADGKLLATGNANGSVLLWDYEQIMRDQFLRAGEKPTELTFVYWNALSAPDPVEAYRAIGALSQRPDEALTLIEDALDALPPAGDTAPEQIDALVKQLGAERLAEQRQASVRLRQLGKRAHPALQRALDAEPPAPVAARIKLLLAAQTQQPQFKLLRALRAIQVLEQIGGDRARRVLERLADSDSERLMSEAKSALARLPAGTGAEHETP